VYAAAKLIPLPARDTKFVPHAFAAVKAILPAPRRAVVSGRDDLVIEDDNRAVSAPLTGGSDENRLRDIEVIVVFVLAIFHLDILHTIN